MPLGTAVVWRNLMKAGSTLFGVDTSRDESLGPGSEFFKARAIRVGSVLSVRAVGEWERVRNEHPLTQAEQRYSRVPGERAVIAALVLLIVATPIVFVRTTMFAFVLPQLTVLWVGASVVLFVGAYRIVVLGVFDRGPRSMTVASVSFVFALAITSILSPQTWAAVTGLSARGAGALTYALCLVIFHTVFGLARRRSTEPLILAFVAAHALIVFYALLQAYGLDPFEWGADALQVGNLVFSTLGNANFSSGYVGLTLPLLVWLAFGSTYPPAARAATGAVAGASVVALVYLNSLQGWVASLAAIAVLVQWAITRDQGDRLASSLVVLLPAVVIAGLPLASNAPSWWLLICLMGGFACCSALGTLQDRRRLRPTNHEPSNSARRRFWAVTMTAIGAVAVGGLLFWDKIADEVASGLEQRVEFWKVSLSIFRESPLVGRGLETYLTYFTTYRSADQAVHWESLLSDSPHSVPLGFLSGGGLVLAVAYLTVLLVIGYFGVRAIRVATGPLRLFYGAVLFSWLAYQVQASVSMDTAGLAYTQWVLGGILVGGGASVSLPPLDLPWKPRMGRRVRRGDSALDTRRLVAALAMTIVCLYCLGLLSAPLRADMAIYRGQQAIVNSDLATAEIEFGRAIELGPRSGFHAENMAYLYELRGLNELAFIEMERGARLQPGVPSVALKAARSALIANHIGAAEGWHEYALEIGPNGGSVLTGAAAFYARTGRSDRATTLLDSFESLESPDVAAWEAARKTYEFLNLAEKADHATICALVGQPGCWEAP